MTTATGSGKSLCFLAWVIDQLTKDKKNNGIVVLPDPGAHVGSGQRLVRLSDKKSLAYPGGQEYSVWWDD